MRFIKAIAINAVVVVGLFGLIELLAWGVLSAYYAWFFSAPRDVEKLVVRQDIFSKGVADEYTAWNQAPFLYRPFIMYRHRPWQSNDFNILPNLRRSNGRSETPRDKCEYRIWMFGSSSLTAPEVRDDETIPARLEQQLNKTGKRFCVENYGQVGYVVQQDLNLFNDLLSQHAPPQMVITFNGWNDANISWDYQHFYSRFDRQFQRAFHPTALDFGIIRNWVNRLLPNTLTVLDKTMALIALKTTSLHTFKMAYITRAKQFAELTRRAYPDRQRVWLTTMRSIIDIAKARGAAVVVTQIPVMMAAKKPWVGFEKSYWQARSLTSFALPENEVKSLRSIDRFAFEQLRRGYQMFDTTAFAQWYRKSNQELAELASQRGIGYADLQAALDRSEHAGKELFISHAHLNAAGLEILAVEILTVIQQQIADSR